jgi:hypothetical protein
MTPAETKKLIEKQVAQTIKKELDKKNYEETAWLKAFKKAEGDETKARLYYVEIREVELTEEIYETMRKNYEAKKAQLEWEEEQRIKIKKKEEEEAKLEAEITKRLKNVKGGGG